MSYKPINQKKTNNHDLGATLNEFDFGDGITAHVGEPGSIKGLYTNKAPKLDIRGQKIDIEYSSTEKEHKELLHLLGKEIK